MSNDKAKSIVKNYFGRQGVKLFNMISRQKPKKADVIVFLQGDRLDRAEKVLELYKNGFASKVVITGNNERVKEFNDSYLSEIKEYFLSQGVPEKSIIIDNKALNTLDQANNVIKIAKEKKWKKLIIVTSPYHILRAYLTFIKQIKSQNWNGSIIIQAADDLLVDNKKLALEMEKIKKYL